MLVGRLTKDSADLRRVTVDFTDWLDVNETISAVTAPVIVVEMNAVFQIGAWSATPLPPPVDSTPMIVVSTTVVDNGLMVQIMLDIGTPGLTYKVTFLATGSSSAREKQIDFFVTVRPVL